MSGARILSGREGEDQAVALLRDGGIVGVPTETVYGLAADAFQPLAVARIYEAKSRPLSDPLIVHLPEAAWLDRVVRFTSARQREVVERLSRAFWPGPMTLLLPRHPQLPDLVTAGMESVAVRVSSHPVFQNLLQRVDSPLAAPSANRFGRISPTTAEDVRIELGERIPLILDGGPCPHGLESTILGLEENGLRILRPGPITQEQLKEFGHLLNEKTSGQDVKTPGSLPGHYAPRKPLTIMERDISPDPSAGLLSLASSRQGFAMQEILSPDGDLREAASRLYGALRRLDDGPATVLYAEKIPEEGLGVAIMDRLRRASHGSCTGTTP